MNTSKIIVLLLLNISMVASCADKKQHLQAKDKKEVQEKQELAFDRYKKKGFLPLMSHGSWAEGDYPKARKLLLEAVDKNHRDAIEFYASRVSTIRVFNILALDGDIKTLKKLLPFVSLTPVWEGVYNKNQELPFADYSGLMAAVSLTTQETKKDEQVVIDIMKTIIDFYTPKEDAQCINHSYWGPCTARCQDRRRAFVAYALAKAGEIALLNEYHEAAQLIYAHPLAFPTSQAIYIAQCSKLSEEKQTALKGLRNLQLENDKHYEKPTALQGEGQLQAYTLLRTFHCINAQRDPSFVNQYLKQLAWPVIRNILYTSWFGYTQACPK